MKEKFIKYKLKIDDPKETLRIESTLKAIMKIKTKHLNTKNTIVGELHPCPHCKEGVITYSISHINQHTNGKCSTKKCLNWIE